MNAQKQVLSTTNTNKNLNFFQSNDTFENFKIL